MGSRSAVALPRDPSIFTEGAFAPLSPLIPTPIDNAAPGTERPEPRRWQYPPAWNLPVGQPGTEGLKLADFATLRLYSDLYSVARACIQLRKDEIIGIAWDIAPTRDAAKAMRGDRKAMRDFGERRAKLLKFFSKPDSNYHDFGSWMSAMLEDLFVIDALSLYLAPSRLPGKGVLGSDLAALEVIDGSTIRPLINLRGGKPEPPNPAYQSYQYGVPRVDLLTLFSGDDAKDMDGPVKQYRGDQLYYLPRWPRSWTVYGQCFDDQTEVLTDQGWKLFRDLDQTEKVATRSPDGRFEWDLPVAYVAKRYDGEVLHFRSQVHDFMVTPEHRLLVQRRPKPDRVVSAQPEFKPAAWFAETRTRGQNWAVPATSTWKGTAPDEILIRGAQPGPGKHHLAEPLRFSPETWMRFLGWYLSEGWVQSQPELKNYISVAQKDPANRALIEATLTEMGVPWRVRERDSGCAEYTFSHEILAQILRQDCYAGGGEFRSWTKRVPADVMNYPADLLAILWETLVLGDGSVSPETGLRRYITTSPHLRDQLTEILQKAGAQGWSENLGKEKEHHHQAYRITERPRDMSQIPYPVKVPYNAMVYCVTVPNGTLYVRRNGRTGWSGNSPLERCILPAMAHLRKQQWQLEFYTEGTIPGMFISPGDPAITPNQIRELQENLNVIAGDQAWKHKMIVLPPGSKTSPQKPPALAGEDDTTLMTEVCMGYSVMPTELGIIPQLGPTVSTAAIRMFSEQTRGIHQRKATIPDLKWLASIFNKIIQQVLGQDDMQWFWEGVEEQQGTPELNADLIGQIEHGGLSIDELRQQNGRDPWDLPLTREPIWATSSGLVPLSAMPAGGGKVPGEADAALAGVVVGGGGNPGRPVDSLLPRQPAQEAPGHAIADGAVTVRGRRAAKAMFAQPAAAAAELAALNRHISKGRDPATWEARYIPERIMNTVISASREGYHGQAQEYLARWEGRIRRDLAGKVAA